MEQGLNDPFRKSSYSGGNGGGCVEVGRQGDTLLIQDSKDPDRRVTLSVSAAAFRVFVREIRNLRRDQRNLLCESPEGSYARLPLVRGTIGRGGGLRYVWRPAALYRLDAGAF
jgi:hypothetical protein